MSTVRVIGSALERAALYVPRKIADRLQKNRLGVIPIESMPGHCAKISVKGGEVKVLGVFKLRVADPLAKGITHVEDEAHGPFVSTSARRLTEDAQGANDVEYVDNQQRWPADDQRMFFPRPIRIEDEAIGPFRSTVVARPKTGIIDRFVNWFRK